MHKVALALVAVLVIVAVAYWYWLTKATAKVSMTGLSAAGSGALVITGTAAAKADPTAWVGKTVTIYTKSLGKIATTVAATTVSASGAVSVTTAPGAYAGSAGYTLAAGDHARVTLKPLKY